MMPRDEPAAAPKGMQREHRGGAGCRSQAEFTLLLTHHSKLRSRTCMAVRVEPR